MAGKKTAVFGIYQNEKQAERTVDDLLAAGFSNDDISVLLPDNRGTKTLRTTKARKRQRARRRSRHRRSDGGTLDCWPGLAFLRFRNWSVHRSRSDYGRMRAWERAAQSGGVIGALVGMGIPEYEAKHTKDTSKRAEFCFRFTARHPRGSRAQKDLLKAYWHSRHRIHWRSQRRRPRGRRGGDMVEGKVMIMLIFIIVRHWSWEAGADMMADSRSGSRAEALTSE